MKITNKIRLLVCVILFGLSTLLFASSLLSPLTDSVNSGIINTKVATNDRLSNINIDATVINGVAVFSGEVRSPAQLQELIRIGRSVSGVKGVDVSQVVIRQ